MRKLTEKQNAAIADLFNVNKRPPKLEDMEAKIIGAKITGIRQDDHEGDIAIELENGSIVIANYAYRGEGHLRLGFTKC